MLKFIDIEGFEAQFLKCQVRSTAKFIHVRTQTVLDSLQDVLRKQHPDFHMLRLAPTARNPRKHSVLPMISVYIRYIIVSLLTRFAGNSSINVYQNRYSFAYGVVCRTLVRISLCALFSPDFDNFPWTDINMCQSREHFFESILQRSCFDVFRFGSVLGKRSM